MTVFLFFSISGLVRSNFLLRGRQVRNAWRLMVPTKSHTRLGAGVHNRSVRHEGTRRYYPPTRFRSIFPCTYNAIGMTVILDDGRTTRISPRLVARFSIRPTRFQRIATTQNFRLRILCMFQLNLIFTTIVRDRDFVCWLRRSRIDVGAFQTPICSVRVVWISLPRAAVSDLCGERRLVSYTRIVYFFFYIYTTPRSRLPRGPVFVLLLYHGRFFG